MTKLWIGKQVSSYQGLGMVGESVMDVIIKCGSEPPLNQLVSDSDSELDSTERLALGSTDTLSNGQKADLEAAQRLATPSSRDEGLLFLHDQASVSLGFSRKEHWNGLPFPSPMHGSEK